MWPLWNQLVSPDHLEITARSPTNHRWCIESASELTYCALTRAGNCESYLLSKGNASGGGITTPPPESGARSQTTTRRRSSLTVATTHNHKEVNMTTQVMCKDFSLDSETSKSHPERKTTKHVRLGISAMALCYLAMVIGSAVLPCGAETVTSGTIGGAATGPVVVANGGGLGRSEVHT